MKKKLGVFLLLAVALFLGGMWSFDAGGGPPPETAALAKHLPGDNKIAGWNQVGEAHPCTKDECLNDPQLGVRQGYPYFSRGAAVALTQSYSHRENKDGMEVTIILVRSMSGAKLIYNELGLPAYWKGQNSLVINIGRDNLNNNIQGRMGRCSSDCRMEFSVGAYLLRLKYYGRPEREKAALVEFAQVIIRSIEG